MPLPHILPEGIRLYVVGDIHGRADLLSELLDLIKSDTHGNVPQTRLVFLGDYIDRGLYSREVVDTLLHLTETEKHRPIFLSGNHEAVLRELLSAYNLPLLKEWMLFGAKEALLSYGIRPPATMHADDLAPVMTALLETISPAHKQFFNTLCNSYSLGDYFFCHAGIRPGLPLEAQQEKDLLWIRHEFLNHTAPHPKMIVHGHTVREEVEFRDNRINLDTGAYASGCLTALAVEGTERWLLQTG